MSDAIPAISVLMPVYNAQRYLAAAVDSILQQTYRDFELIIINDGATDDSPAMLRDYVARDSRIRLISRENRGLVRTLNELVSLARAPLIARMDADDISLPRRFELQKAFMDAHPEVVLLGGRVELMDEKSRDIFTIFEEMDDEAAQRELLSGNSVVAHPAAMMRTEAVRSLGGYHDLKPSEDLDLWLRLGEIGKIHVLGQVLLRYREHSGSISTQEHGKQLEKMRQVCEMAWKRRGITGRFTNTGWRTDNPRDVCERMMKYGWTAFGRGNRSLTLEFAAKAIAAQPTRFEAWKLLACGMIKPMKPQPAATC